MAEQSYGDWIRSNPPLPTKKYKKEHMVQMKIFKELNKIGFKHYTENTIEELDNLPLDSEERIMEQSLVFLWFRKKYNLSSTIIHRVNIDDGGVCYDWLIIGQDVKYRHFDTYEEAELAAIVKLIEIVRKQNLNNKHMAQQNQIGDTDKMVTALEWLYGIMFVKKGAITLEEYQHALEMNKHQHGNTWDAAIQAHDNRGHVHARSLVDFDEYFEEQFKK